MAATASRRQTNHLTNHPIMTMLVTMVMGLLDRLESVFDTSDHARVTQQTRMAVGGAVKQFAKGAMIFVVGVIILNELFGLGVVNNSTGPFASTLTTLENLLGAALVFVALGFLALGGAVAMRYMDRF